MSEGYLRYLSGGAVEAFSAGSQPGDKINPSAVACMHEVGIDISGGFPKARPCRARAQCRGWGARFVPLQDSSLFSREK